MRLGPIARSVHRQRLTFLSAEKLQCLERALATVIEDGVEGSILEFGVALGGSAALLASRASVEHPFHGFDVFGMIPPPKSEKDDQMSRDR
jgi:asparagine synthase (glutamine-hydrolysing)